MGQCKKDKTPLLTHWSDVFFALTYRYGMSGLILGLRTANERRRYFVTTSLIRRAQA